MFCNVGAHSLYYILLCLQHLYACMCIGFPQCRPLHSHDRQVEKQMCHKYKNIFFTISKYGLSKIDQDGTIIIALGTHTNICTFIISLVVIILFLYLMFQFCFLTHSIFFALSEMKIWVINAIN